MSSPGIGDGSHKDFVIPGDLRICLTVAVDPLSSLFLTVEVDPLSSLFGATHFLRGFAGLRNSLNRLTKLWTNAS